MKINFLNDYNSVGHPDIIRAISDAEKNKYAGYGLDEECDSAIITIREFVGQPDAHVHFFVGGTQVNKTTLAAFLRPYEAVVSVASGHINVHETGAIEANGHKILSAKSSDGKITPMQVEALCTEYSDEHSVKPRLLYISQSTEYGTLYSLSELKALREACNRFNLLLYIDGARLGVALTSESNDISIKEIAALSDAFYIGGTKNGLLFGEALVITNESLEKDFRYMIKQNGGLLAKGFLLGLQFDYAIKSGLYLSIPQTANAQAKKLREGLKELNCLFDVDSPTNQIFPVFRNEIVAELEKEFLFEIWGKFDDEHTTVRFVTSWQTTDDEIAALIAKLEALLINNGGAK